MGRSSIGLITVFFRGLVAILIATTARAATLEFAASDAPLLNPERGLYGHAPMVRRTRFDRLRASGVSLVYAQIYLPEFRDRAISAERLEELSDAFDRIRAAGLKGIVRVSYSNRIGMPDADLEQIQEHVDQLAPLFDRHKDVIAFFQAGFIGAWGEWHSSTNELDTALGRETVLKLLLEKLPKDRFVQVRTPMAKWDVFDKGVTEETAFSEAAVARVGYHNDCFLAGSTDAGTYPADQIELWKQRVASETRFVPIGGETCRQNRRAQCETALGELERLHWTYLNRDYHPGVIRDLQPCWKTITNRLGYRFELLRCELPKTLTAGSPLPFTIHLRNVGFAPLYNARPVFFRIFAKDQMITELELPDTDPRRWSPGKEIVLRGEILLPKRLPAGGIGCALWMPDAEPRLRGRSEYSIQFGNRNVWDPERGHNVLSPSIPVE